MYSKSRQRFFYEEAFTRLKKWFGITDNDEVNNQKLISLEDNDALNDVRTLLEQPYSDVLLDSNKFKLT